MSWLHVCETFLSLDGEVNGNGPLRPSFFIRLAGCNLHCKWCDSEYSRDYDNGIRMTVDEIIVLVEQAGCPLKITITGGEPLMQAPLIFDLIMELLQRQYYVSVETNGSILIPGHVAQNLSYVIDYKLDQPEKMAVDNFLLAGKNDWIKFVIDNDADFDQAKAMAEAFVDAGSQANIAFSPVVTKLNDPGLISERSAWLAKKILDSQLWHVTLNLQFHKIIWPPAFERRLMVEK